ncbi:LysR family transcriptional regulator [Photobacterium sagamiensis]|uniref:LysR family transcriptional regulator n=1 Tax=Photobacterium sagamiensis TaxID=2910241 RepID=UPI003D140EFB
MKSFVSEGRITLKMLRYFYEVAKVEHFGQAAKVLNITKSPLSAKIKELEDILGHELFTRDSRNVELTKVGNQLRNECTRLFEMIDNSLNSVIKSGREQKNIINIGLVSSVFYAGFGSALKRFKKQYPNYHFNFIELAPKQQKKSLLDKSIDVGLSRSADSFNIHPLSSEIVFKENMCVAVSDEHQFKDRKLVSISELENEEFVFLDTCNSASAEMFINTCLAEGYHPRIVQEVIEPSTIMAVVATSDLISIVPTSFSHNKWDNVRFIRLKENLPADLCALYDRRNNSPIVSHFIEMIRSQFSQ